MLRWWQLVCIHLSSLQLVQKVTGDDKSLLMTLMKEAATTTTTTRKRSAVNNDDQLEAPMRKRNRKQNVNKAKSYK